jgi:hypothetical protein
VSYLQGGVNQQRRDVGCKRIMSDMNAWGYNFRISNTLD